MFFVFVSSLPQVCKDQYKSKLYHLAFQIISKIEEIIKTRSPWILLEVGHVYSLWHHIQGIRGFKV